MGLQVGKQVGLQVGLAAIYTNVNESLKKKENRQLECRNCDKI